MLLLQSLSKLSLHIATYTGSCFMRSCMMRMSMFMIVVSVS